MRITDIIMTLRNMAVEEGHMAEAHRRTAGMLVRTGHAIPMTDKFKEFRKTLKLDEVPRTVLSDPKLYEEVKKIMEATKFDKLIGARLDDHG